MLRTPFHQTPSQPFPTSRHFADGSMAVPNLKVHVSRSQPATGSTLMKAWGMSHPGLLQALQFFLLSQGKAAMTPRLPSSLHAYYPADLRSLVIPNPERCAPGIPKPSPSGYFLLVLYPALVGGSTKAMGEHFQAPSLGAVPWFVEDAAVAERGQSDMLIPTWSCWPAQSYPCPGTASTSPCTCTFLKPCPAATSVIPIPFCTAGRQHSFLNASQASSRWCLSLKANKCFGALIYLHKQHLNYQGLRPRWKRLS